MGKSGGGRGFLQHVPVQGDSGCVREWEGLPHGQLTASPACPLPFPDVSPDITLHIDDSHDRIFLRL